MQSHEHEQNQISKAVGRDVCGDPPKISVVIPAYNVAEYIGETLGSVAVQTFRDYETIVVNDGSPDTERLEKALEPYFGAITYVRQANAGAGAARNAAIELARGEIIAFLDGDDVWLPDYLESQTEFLDVNGLDMAYCDAILFGMPSSKPRSYMDTAPSRGAAGFDAILGLRCNVITSGTLVRKQAVIDAGMFENEMVKAEDFHLWLRIAKTGAKIGYQRKQLLKYRIHLASLSGDAISRVERSIAAFERVLRTIDLTPEQRMTANRRIAGFKVDLAVEHGKASLLKGDFAAAAEAFNEANTKRHTLKMTAVVMLARFAPEMLRKHYLRSGSHEIALVRNLEKYD